MGVNCAAILKYSSKKISQSTVRRCYDKWRQEQNLPRRCDNPGCAFHDQPLMWNGKQLPLILDHIDGNRRDNRPESLRYLCPNCDSQLATRGGANKGRVRRIEENGFLLISREGTQSYTFFPSGGAVAGGAAEVSFSHQRDRDSTNNT